MYARLLSLPLAGDQSIFLFGPRGTGKTSWLKSHLPEALYIDLLDFSAYSLLHAQPHRLSNLIPPSYDNWVIIDEVQRIPELLNEVHRLIEQQRLRFILTGSSARSLRAHGVNLLAGRALRYHMHPLTPQEMGSDFDLTRALTHGMLPMAQHVDQPRKYLESYVQTYLKEEVMQEGLTRNIGAFAHFLEAASFSQGNTLNCAEIARELSINRLTVANYFTILEDLLLGVMVTPFAQRAKRKLTVHEKFFFFDAGVYRAVRPTGPLDSPQEIDGAALETLFLQSARAINDYHDLHYKIHYWRTQSGTEIDFVLYGPHGLHAFEIKRSSQVSNKFLRGLKLFKEDYPEASAYLLNTGSHTEYHGDVTVMPFEKALRILPALLRGKHIV